MPRKCKLILIAVAAISVFSSLAAGQDSPSLGDVARQQRLQRAAAGTKDPDAPNVVTNEEIPENSPPQPPANPSTKHGNVSARSNAMKQSGERWRSQIQTQKSQIANLQKQIDQLNQSIRFASHPCNGPRCVEWNERQRQKQQQVERMQAELDTKKKALEQAQESARRQGFGNSVYEPDVTK